MVEIDDDRGRPMGDTLDLVMEGALMLEDIPPPTAREAEALG